jgi:hypothetical protein
MLDRKALQGRFIIGWLPGIPGQWPVLEKIAQARSHFKPESGGASLSKLITILLLLFAIPVNAQSLAERLGYKTTDKLLIVNADDVAMSHEANAATIDGMENGQITSGSVMVP